MPTRVTVGIFMLLRIGGGEVATRTRESKIHVTVRYSVFMPDKDGVQYLSHL